MKEIPKTRKNKMGAFNNQMVELIDNSGLTPPETIVILRQIANRLEILFELAIRKEK